MARRDLYEVLGVSRDADGARLKRAYRELAMKFHPDQNPGDPAAEAAFKEVSAAYTILSDPEARERYDRRGFAGVDGGAAPDLGAFTELFEGVFGDLFGRKKERRAGRDLKYTLELDLEEAALGTKKTITFPSRERCGECGGSGARGERGKKTCPTCDGAGELKVQQGFFGVKKRCPTCGGRGYTILEACPRCAGDGTVETQRSFEVTIPAGMFDGSVKRVAGEGEPGANGAANGDLHIFVKVRPHPLLRREGDVIACDVPISLRTAMLGGTIEVPTLEGTAEMKIPAGTQSAAVFRLRGKGSRLGNGTRGDLHVRVRVEIPVSLEEKQRVFIHQLDAALDASQRPEQGKYDEALAALKARRS